MNAPTPAVIEEGGYRDVIVRLAVEGKIEQLERMVRLQEEHLRYQEARELRAAEREWNLAHAEAEAEIAVVIASTPNPQTKRKYANFATLDGAVRPIYTKHGFSISFDTEPHADPNKLLIVGYLAKGLVRRRFQTPIPIETTGIKGGQATTLTWAHGAAKTYGRRYLLIDMFNIAIADQDDDGARAGRSLKGGDVAQQQQQPQEPVGPPIDPKTGEILPPHPLEYIEGENWVGWARRFDAAFKEAKTEAALNQWIEHNKQALDEMKSPQGQPQTYHIVEAGINKHRNHIKLKDNKK